MQCSSFPQDRFEFSGHSWINSKDVRPPKYRDEFATNAVLNIFEHFPGSSQHSYLWVAIINLVGGILVINLSELFRPWRHMKYYRFTFERHPGRLWPELCFDLFSFWLLTWNAAPFFGICLGPVGCTIFIEQVSFVLAACPAAVFKSTPEVETQNGICSRLFRFYFQNKTMASGVFPTFQGCWTACSILLVGAKAADFETVWFIPLVLPVDLCWLMTA